LSESEIFERELRRVERQVAPEPIVLGTNRRTKMIADLWQDLRFGARMLLKQPGFTLIAVLTLALGIGANTSIFSLFDTILLRTLPVQRPEQLVILRRVNSSRAGAEERFSYPAYQRFRGPSSFFSGVLASGGIRLSNIFFSEGEAEHAGMALVSGNYFSVLGVSVTLGRALTDADDVLPGSHPVAVISHRYWQRRFGRAPAVLGKTFTLNQTSFTIIGVTPPGFYGESIEGTPDMWIPLAMRTQVIPSDPSLDRPTTNWLHVLARLQPGVAEQQPAALLSALLQQALSEINPSSIPPEQRHRLLQQRVDLMPGSKGLADVRQQFSLTLSVLMGIVGFVLLMACTNLANLLLAQANRRRKEIAVRLALGAGRWRLIRQLLTESALLAMLGGGLGLCFAYWVGDGVAALLNWDPAFPMAIKFTLDLRLLIFTGTVSLLSGILFGLAPALRATRLNINSELKGGALSLGGGATHWNLSRLLVIGQVAVSFLVLIGAGLFVRSLQKLQSMELGFRHENVLLLKYDPATTGYKGAQLASLYQRLLERVEAMPGVRSASVSAETLIAGGVSEQRIYLPGSTPQPTGNLSTYLNLVAPRYFETLGMSLMQGRGFRPQDHENAPDVAIINETLARDFFGQESPLGRYVGMGNGENRRRLEIVGVVRDAKYADLRESPHRMLYRPFTQVSQQSESICELQVRTEGAPLSLATALQREIRLVDPRLSVAVLDIRALTTQINDSLVTERLTAKLSSLFGLVALILAALGLFAVLSFSVSQRTSEIGIRMALGARPRDVLKLVIGQGLRLALIGVALGLVAAVALTRIVAGLLYGVSKTDPVTFTVVALLLVSVALLACWLPARRATKVDPMIALRSE
jgi:predicted permease